MKNRAIIIVSFYGSVGQKRSKLVVNFVRPCGFCLCLKLAHLIHLHFSDKRLQKERLEGNFAEPQ